MKRLCFGCVSTAILFFVLTITGWAQKSVVMQHADLNRTGWYDQETSLTVNNVKPGSFGKVFERIVDDQPLSGRVQGLREISLTLQRGGQCVGGDLRGAQLRSLIIGKKEGLVSAVVKAGQYDRTSQAS